MHPFKDSEGRQWSIVLNGWQLKKLKEQIDFDARDHQSILRAAEDPALLVNVLFLLCEEQAIKLGVSDQQFGESMGGDAIDDATAAYLAESVDFFPRSQRPALTKVLDMMKTYRNRATALATEKLTAPAMKKLMTNAMKESSQKIDRLLAGKPTGKRSGKSQAQ